MNTSSDYTLIIESGKARADYWKDLWNSRELLYMLAKRDILVRYKQTVIGVAWAIIRPFLMMLVFTFVFSRVANLPSEGPAPYAIMVYLGTIIWQLFSTSIGDVGNSLVNNLSLVAKIYCPRLIIPSSAVAVNFVDFCISFLLLIVLCIWYSFVPSINIIFSFPIVFVLLLLSLGSGLIFCSMYVRFRDFKFLLPFIIQVGTYASPVGFNSSVIPEKWFWIYQLNPIVGIIDAFRWSIIGGSPFPYQTFGISCIMTLALLFLGLKMFRSAERSFADII